MPSNLTKYYGNIFIYLIFSIIQQLNINNDLGYNIIMLGLT